MSTSSLLAEARAVATRPDRKLGATRCVAAALLARQALEEALEAFWLGTAPGVARCSGRAQLIALPYFADSDLAGDVAYAWNRLSRACHRGAYGLPPAPTELAGLFEIVDRFTRVIPSSPGC